MKKVLFATENESKCGRFKNALLKNNIEIITINDIDKKQDIIENGKDAIENALIKARAYAKVVDKPSNKINPGYPLNTISINKKLNKYFTNITEDDKKKIKEDESNVIDFLCKYL